jgi:hypothetical protein
MTFVKRALPVLLAFLVMAPQAFAQSKTHNLTVTSNVRGAQIQITAKRGGTESGLTDATFKLAPGEYSVRVVADGYKAEMKSVSLKKDTTLHFELARTQQEQTNSGPFKLTVTSNTNTAKIKVSGPDGTQQGPVNTAFNVKGGKYTIEVSASGYQTKVVSVNMTSDQKIRVELEPDVVVQTTYSLTIDSNVSDAMVVISGNGIQLDTDPGKAVSLSSGSYKITVSAPGYNANSVNINLTGNQRVRIDLTGNTFKLVVSSNVASATVHVRGNGIDELASVGSAFRVPSGSYNVEVSADGYESGYASINVSNDQKIRIDLKQSGYNLTVKSDIKNTKIEISGNGVSMSGTAELSTRLAPGKYKVTATANGHATETREVNLTSDQTIEFKMRKANGMVMIYIGGSSVNKKDLQGREMLEVYDNGQRLVSDDFVFEMKPGQHTIQIVSGALMSQVTLNIEGGRTYIIEPVMSLSVK